MIATFNDSVYTRDQTTVKNLIDIEVATVGKNSCITLACYNISKHD